MPEIVIDFLDFLLSFLLEPWLKNVSVPKVYLIHNDPQLFDHVTEKRVECRALNIPEELGQVQYMFCDKVS